MELAVGYYESLALRVAKLFGLDVLYGKNNLGYTCAFFVETGVRFNKSGYAQVSRSKIDDTEHLCFELIRRYFECRPWRTRKDGLHVRPRYVDQDLDSLVSQSFSELDLKLTLMGG